MPLPGCGGGTPAPVGAGSSTPAGPSGPELVEISDLGLEGPTRFAVEAEKRSLAVVERFEKDLAARGWKPVQPANPQDPGQREWLRVPGAAAGATDLYDAAWTDPATGRKAVLNLWHDAAQADVQHGTFEIQSP